MDQKKMGRLIFTLRREQGLTQRQIGETVGVDHRTVSKWERGLGCPDVSLLGSLAARLGVPIERLLLGELDPNDTDGGNMKRTKFYVCPDCGNLLTATGGAELFCCGRRLKALRPQKTDGDHCCTVQEVEDDWYITFPHPMRKDHFIRFAAYVGYDRVLVVKLYPEQGGEARFPRMHGGKLYLCCSSHGLFEVNL